MVDVIHIHEDAWGMRNVYPLAARAEVEADIAEARAAAERYRAPDGFGFTGVYFTKPPSQDYSDHGLTLSAIETALASIFPRVRRFNATTYSAMGRKQPDPFGSYDDDAWCFGLGPNCYVKIDPKNGLVGDIWFDLNTEDPAKIGLMRRALEAVDALVPSMIADYYLDFAGKVGCKDELDRYFAAFSDQRRMAAIAFGEYQASLPQPATSTGFLNSLTRLFRTKRDS